LPYLYQSKMFVSSADTVTLVVSAYDQEPQERW
jgi:hypothetical protein